MKQYSDLLYFLLYHLRIFIKLADIYYLDPRSSGQSTHHSYFTVLRKLLFFEKNILERRKTPAFTSKQSIFYKKNNYKQLNKKHLW